ncbi:MAG: amidohydrolase [Candidatus Micrarchaeota archaeon]|nr:amidohydrolase [Candidatus Micrarchaeota archaeon]
MPLLIKRATLLSGKKADVLLQDGKISKIAPQISFSGDKLDGSGKLLLPGLINTHTHAAMSLLRGLAEDMQLSDWLKKVWAYERIMSPASVRAGAELACLEMLQSGTTCFSDMYFHMDEVALAAKKSGIRAVLGYGMIDLGDAKKRKSELACAERFIKEWNGKADGRISCSVAPHSIYTCSAELLLQSRQLSEKYSLPMHIHLSETRAEVFDCLKEKKARPAYYLDRLGAISEKMVAAHCVWLTKEEVRLLALRKASASLNPISNMKLAGGSAAPMPEMQEFGMNVSIGTDGPASGGSFSMFDAMRTLALLQKNQRWDARVAKDSDVLQAATLGGARALGVPAGQIKEGALADLILLDLRASNLMPAHSLCANVVYSAHAGNVTDVIVDGKVVVESRRVLAFDADKVAERAAKEAQRLSDKASALS